LQQRETRSQPSKRNKTAMATKRATSAVFQKGTKIDGRGERKIEDLAIVICCRQCAYGLRPVQ
jgi:hypothetical protein